MDFSPVYLLARLGFRLVDFFHHWYIDGSRWFGRVFMGTLAAADRTFAVKITLQHFFEPLYKDYSVIGRIMGVVFRSFRVVIGGVAYLILAFFFALAYGIWLAIPVTILYYVVRNF